MSVQWPRLPSLSAGETSATGLARSFQPVVGLVPRPTLRLAPKGPNSIAQANGLGRRPTPHNTRPNGGPEAPESRAAGPLAPRHTHPVPRPAAWAIGFGPFGAVARRGSPNETPARANVQRGKVASPACARGPGGASCVAGMPRPGLGERVMSRCSSVGPTGQPLARGTIGPILRHQDPIHLVWMVNQAG